VLTNAIVERSSGCFSPRLGVCVHALGRVAPEIPITIDAANAALAVFARMFDFSLLRMVSEIVARAHSFRKPFAEHEAHNVS
jgi:hypothetical protein